MIGALGGRDARAFGVRCSEYENARGTGNVDMWFEVGGGVSAAA